MSCSTHSLLSKKFRATRHLSESIPEQVRIAIGRRIVRFQPGAHPHLRVKFAQTREELEGAFRVLHDSYVAAGLMQAHPSGMRVTDFHALPTTSTAIALWDGVVIGTTSLIRDSAFGLPVDATYDLSPLRKTGKRLVELSGVAVHRDFRRRAANVLLAVLRLLYRYAVRLVGVDHFLGAVHPRAVARYRMLFDMRPLPGARAVEDKFVRGAPAVGMLLDLENAARYLRRHFPSQPKHRDAYYYFVEDPSGDEGLPARDFLVASDPVMTPENLDYFYNQKTRTFAELPADKARELWWFYDSPSYAAVLPPQGRDRSSEKRSEVRFDANCRGRVRVGNVRDRLFVGMTVFNVSGGGLRAALQHDLAFDRSYDVEIALSEFDIAKLHVRPVWRSGERLFGFRVERADVPWQVYLDHLHTITRGRAP